VHKIFNSSESSAKGLSEKALLKILALMVLVDVAVMVVWTVWYPLVLIQDMSGSEDLLIVSAERCQGPHREWFGGVFALYKGAMLIGGAYLAIRTRKVALRDMRESKLVGAAIYNIIIIASITVPVLILISRDNKNVTATLILLGVSVVTAYSVVLALIIVFKLYLVFIAKVTTEGERGFSNGGAGSVHRRGTTVDSGSVANRSTPGSAAASGFTVRQPPPPSALNPARSSPVANNNYSPAPVTQSAKPTLPAEITKSPPPPPAADTVVPITSTVPAPAPDDVKVPAAATNAEKSVSKPAAEPRATPGTAQSVQSPVVVSPDGLPELVRVEDTVLDFPDDDDSGQE
jgi:hypothetical protein